MARSRDDQRAAYEAAMRATASTADTWAPPQGAIHKVLIMLSPLAPGLDQRPLSDDARWRWMTWVTPAQVTRRVLMRLDRRADQVSLRATDGLDGVEVHDLLPPPGGVGSGGPEGPTTAARIKGCERLLAIIFNVPAAAVRLAWAALMPSAEIERHAIEGATVLTLKPKEAA